MTDAAIEAALRRDRAIVAAALFVLAGLAWAHILWLATDMDMRGMPEMDMPGMAMAPGYAAWSLSHALFVFVMWSVMMVGMMTPSVAPMVLIYAQVARQAHVLGRAFAPAGWFAAGYLLAWVSFAALATSAQYGFESAALLSPLMMSTSRYFAGAILLLAGIYQLTPLKNTCLVQCRAPLRFVQNHGGFKPGIGGSLHLGLLHGLYCIGCCWALMALLFVGGVMNVLWIAALAIVVLAEKILPGGTWLARFGAIVAIAAGAWMLA